MQFSRAIYECRPSDRETVLQILVSYHTKRVTRLGSPPPDQTLTMKRLIRSNLVPIRYISRWGVPHNFHCPSSTCKLLQQITSQYFLTAFKQFPKHTIITMKASTILYVLALTSTSTCLPVQTRTLQREPATLPTPLAMAAHPERRGSIAARDNGDTAAGDAAVHVPHGEPSGEMYPGDVGNENPTGSRHAYSLSPDSEETPEQMERMEQIEEIEPLAAGPPVDEWSV